MLSKKILSRYSFSSMSIFWSSLRHSKLCHTIGRSMHHFEKHHHFKQSDLNISLLYLFEWMAINSSKNCQNHCMKNMSTWILNWYWVPQWGSKYKCIFDTIHAEQYKKNSSRTRSLIQISRGSPYIPRAFSMMFDIHQTFILKPLTTRATSWQLFWTTWGYHT